MPRPKPEVERVLISLRILPDALKALDKRRGNSSRAEYLEAFLAESSKPISAKLKTISTKPVEDISVGAPKAAPGSRLKKR